MTQTEAPPRLQLSELKAIQQGSPSCAVGQQQRLATQPITDAAGEQESCNGQSAHDTGGGSSPRPLGGGGKCACSWYLTCGPEPFEPNPVPVSVVCRYHGGRTGRLGR